MRYLAVFAVLLASCGDNSDCDFDKISGTYRVSFDEVSGDCGDLPDINTFIEGGDEEIDPGCTVASRTENERTCAGDADVTCNDTVNNLRIRQVIHLEPEPDGSSISGSTTIQAYRLSTGAYVCTSTYEVEYTRL